MTELFELKEPGGIVFQQFEMNLNVPEYYHVSFKFSENANYF